MTVLEWVGVVSCISAVIVCIVSTTSFKKQNKADEYSRGQRNGEQKALLQSMCGKIDDTNTNVKQIKDTLSRHGEELSSIKATQEAQRNQIEIHDKRILKLEERECNFIGR